MSSISRSTNYEPILAKGVVTAFDTLVEELQKIAFISLIEEFPSENTDIPQIFEKLLNLFSEVMEDSSTEHCLRFMDFMKNIPNEKWSFLNKFQKETIITDIYQHCRKLRDLVEQKLSVPLQLWRQTKADLIEFPQVYGKLLEELDSVRHKVQKARHLKDKVMPEQTAKEENARKVASASEDFTSLHPFFVIANSKEHMEYLRIYEEKKLQTLQEQRVAEEKFKSATLKYRKETQNIIEEEIKEEWNYFSTEMEKSRNLCKLYDEKNLIYLEIEREKKDKERVKNQSAAATLLQAHWRGYITRRNLRESLY